MVDPGDIVKIADERRTVVDVATYEEGTYAVLRYCDDDSRRRVDRHGGDLMLDAQPVEQERHAERGLPPMIVVGHV